MTKHESNAAKVFAKIRRHWLISWILVLAAVVVGVAEFGESLEWVWGAITRSSTNATSSSTTLEPDSLVLQLRAPQPIGESARFQFAATLINKGSREVTLESITAIVAVVPRPEGHTTKIDNYPLTLNPSLPQVVPGGSARKIQVDLPDTINALRSVDSAVHFIKLTLVFVALDSDGVRYETQSHGEIELERQPSAFDELTLVRRDIQLLNRQTTQ